MSIQFRSSDGIESPFNGDNIPFNSSILDMNLKTSTKLIFPKSALEAYYDALMRWDFG